MGYFGHILLHNIIPLSIMIGLGAGLYRRFLLDIKTFSKLIFYLFTPVMIFKLLYESELSAVILFQIILFIVLFLGTLYAIAEVVLRFRKVEGGMKSAMRNSVLFYNSANYAIPLNQLVFANNPFTMSVQLIVMVFQSVLPNTYGIYAVNAHKSTLRETLRTIARMPVIYAVPLAVVLKELHIPIPQPLYEPVTYIANGYTALALLTLGVQLGQMKWQPDRLANIAWSNVLRLCVAPLLGFGIVWLLGIHGLMAQALVLSCAVPTSLASVLLAVEFDNEPDFASQAVFSSTVASIVTVTLVIYLIRFIP
ncbi:AEC family transporter [Gorillibacterium sp. sgz5001074]|uniref:AEC family transporter n=1 Tax=Gorillibacterium sp. sgz5001074 TaxID=3446695 RepID=UPI003F67DA52